MATRLNGSCDAAGAGPRRSRRHQRKQELAALLVARDLPQIRVAATRDPSLTSVLVASLHDPDALTRFRAIEALGHAAAAIAATNLERVRDLVRRQFWALNDESGNIAWHAPEAIGQILCHVPPLAEEYAIQLYGFATTSPFEAGVHFAIAELAPAHPRLVRELVPSLVEACRSPLPAVRGHAARALKAQADPLARAAVAPLASDLAEVETYDFDSGTLVTRTVAALAA